MREAVVDVVGAFDCRTAAEDVSPLSFGKCDGTYVSPSVPTIPPDLDTS
jgi:hypothetical protein